MDEKERNPGMASYCLDIITATLERTIRRLWVLCIVLALMLAGSWAGFLMYLNQYDFESYAVELSTEGGGHANYIGQDGDIYNGESEGLPPDAD